MTNLLWPISMAIICFGVSLSGSEIKHDDNSDIQSINKQNISSDYIELYGKEWGHSTNHDDTKSLEDVTTENEDVSHSRVDQNFTNLIRINELLDVFNIENVGASWASIQGHLNANCSRDMTDYFQGLQDGDVWAIKSMSQK